MSLISDQKQIFIFSDYKARALLGGREQLKDQICEWRCAANCDKGATSVAQTEGCNARSLQQRAAFNSGVKRRVENASVGILSDNHESRIVIHD